MPTNPIDFDIMRANVALAGDVLADMLRRAEMGDEPLVLDAVRGDDGKWSVPSDRP